MEKRAIIAVVLSIGVFYAFTALFPPQKPAKPDVAQVATSTATSQVTTAGSPPPAAPDVSTRLTAPGVTTLQAASARDITVDTPLYTAVFSSQGGSLKRFTLKKFHEAINEKGKNVSIVDESDPVNYTLKSSATGFALDPLTLYSSSTEALTLAPGESKSLVFTAVTGNGLTVRKSYIFSADGYGIDLKSDLVNSGTARVDGTLQLIMTYHTDPKVKESRFETHGPVNYADNKLHIDKSKDVAEKGMSYSTPLWTAFADKYFISALLAKNSSIASVRLQGTPRAYLEDIVSAPAVSLEPGASKSFDFRLYFGPKDLDLLKAQGNSLEQSLDLGWFAALAKPLLYILKYFYQFTHNYGLAIIIITVILKGIFYPLTHKSYKSMKEMQKLQPKMTELKERYKNDRDAMNKAVMELYRTHKVNPLGGCLPMLVQIPVFFALYKALMFSIELRHAPFYFWITDLSSKDPYYVTPVIMGVTMVIQQRMTPSNMDPTQAKMMMFLPVIFTFMFLNFPSGLVIYWLVNNVLTIAQQYYINKSVT